MPMIRAVKFGDFASSIIALVSGIRKKSPKTHVDYDLTNRRLQ